MIRRNLVFVLFALAGLASMAGASSVFPMTLATNTFYQNANSIPLIIYATDRSGTIFGYIGNSTANMKAVIHDNFTLAIAGGTLVYNNTETMVVPQDWYYKFNYTTTPIFRGEFVNYTQVFLNIPPLSAPQYSAAAEIAYSIGAFLFIFILLIGLDIIKLQRSLIGAIAGLTIAFISAISIIFGMIYVDTFTQQAYTIIAYNQTMTVTGTSISTMQLGSNNVIGVFGYAMLFIDLIIGFAYFFLAAFVYGKEKTRKKYR